MRVFQWRGGLAVRLPKALVEAMGLTPGDAVELRAIGARRLAVVRAEDAAFLDQLSVLQKPAPEGFRWSRDEANAR